jgi:hypothetical protein
MNLQPARGNKLFFNIVCLLILFLFLIWGYDIKIHLEFTVLIIMEISLEFTMFTTVSMKSRVFYFPHYMLLHN